MFEGKKERLVVMVCIILATLSFVLNTVVGSIQRADIVNTLNYIGSDYELENINESLHKIQKELDYIHSAISYISY